MEYDYQKAREDLERTSDEFRKKYERFKELQKERTHGLDVIGMPEIGRITLGTEVPIRLLRILLFGQLECFSTIVGESATSGLIYRSGRDAGKELLKGVKTKGLHEALERVAEILEELKIGMVSITKESKESCMLRIDECAFCSGMLNVGRTICRFEAGLIAGLLESLLGKPIEVEETKCWGKGDEFCEFEIRVDYE